MDLFKYGLNSGFGTLDFKPFGLGIGSVNDNLSPISYVSDMSFTLVLLVEFGYVNFIFFILLLSICLRNFKLPIIILILCSINIGTYSDFFLFSFPLICLSCPVFKNFNIFKIEYSHTT